MNIETLLPYHWLATCPKEVVDLDAVPLFGELPAFKWEDFSNSLAQALAIEDLRVSSQDPIWIEKDQLLNGMGSKPQILEIKVPPLEGSCFFIIPEESLKTLFTLTVGTEEALFPDQEVEWEKEFYHFAAFEALQSFQKAGFDPSFIPQLQEEANFEEETPCLGLSILLETAGKKITGRLLITPALRSAFQNKFSNTSMKMTDDILDAALVTLQVIGGSTLISRSSWNNLKTGDFLVLDSCSFSPDEDKSRAQLSLNGQSLFRAKLKDGQIKILEHPLLYEVNTPMAKDEDFEDEELETEDETDYEDDLTEDETIEETEDESESEMEADDHTDDESLTEEEAEDEATPPVAKPAPLSKSAVAKPEAAPSNPLSHPEEIPMNVTIEAGRIRLTVKQLTELQPGNIIDLNIRPERGVDLTINGRCIGRGELLKIGEMLGVRLLEKA